MKEMGQRAKEFWDILLVRQDGKWLAFRSPLQSLQNVASYFAVLVCILIFSVLGWVVSRWKIERQDRNLVFARLQIKSLEKRLEGVGGGANEKLILAPSKNIQSIPALAALPSTGASLSADSVRLKFDAKKGILSLKAQIKRSEKRSVRYKWLLLLSGSNGLLVFPDAITRSGGSLLNTDSAKSFEFDDFKYTLASKFESKGFVKKAPSIPYQGHLLIFDEKGSMVLKKDVELSFGA